MPKQSYDGSLIDWLETFAVSIEHDDALGLWTVHSAQPGYPTGAGRTLRAAAADARHKAELVDARPRTIALAR